MEKIVRLPPSRREAQIRSGSYDADSNTIEIIWTTGATVRRVCWLDGEEYDEVLSLAPGAVRLERLNAGAPFVDTHATYSLSNIIGSVVPETARIEDGRGIATVLLSRAPGVADTVQKIREGVIRNTSVGYWTHRIEKTEPDDTRVARWEVVDWEPLEISAVPVGADPGSQIRSENTGESETRACVLVTRTPASGPTSKARKERPMANRDKQKVDPEEKKRLAALRAAKRDDDETEKDEDRDEDAESDDERDDDETESKSNGERSDADEDKDEDRGRDEEDDENRDDDEDDDKGGDERSARHVAERAVAAERARIASISEIAERAGLPKLGKRHVLRGTPVRRFRDLVLDKLIERQGQTAIGSTGADGLTKERMPRGRSAEQREMTEGERHWRSVAGKPASA